LNNKKFITHPYFDGKSTNLMIGVFDGHGGEGASQYLSEYFIQRFLAKFTTDKEICHVFQKSIFSF